MENNNNGSLSFFSGFSSDNNQPITTSHMSTNPIWFADSAAIVESARMKIKRRIHSRSPLSSIENLPRGTGPAARVGPMKVGTKEDDVLVMDAVMLDSNSNRVEKSAIGKPPVGPKSYQYTVSLPVQQKKATQFVKENSVWDSNYTEEEQEAYILKVLYGPSDKKRLSVFIDICSE